MGQIGIHQALLELQQLGLIDAELPRMVVVQSTGCAPLVRAWEQRAEASERWSGASTVAFGINVPKALGDFLVLRAIYDTDVLGLGRTCGSAETMLALCGFGEHSRGRRAERYEHARPAMAAASPSGSRWISPSR